jgi:predicted amidohydrolase
MSSRWFQIIVLHYAAIPVGRRQQRGDRPGRAARPDGGASGQLGVTTVRPRLACGRFMVKKTLCVAAAQMKFRPTLPENISLIRQFIQLAGRAACDVVLFPECALTGYSGNLRRHDAHDIEAGLNSVAEAARRHHCHVLVGSPTFARGRRFNSLVVFDRQGRERFRYHKVHLTPHEVTFFTPGDAVALFRLDGVAGTSIICHERRYPELVRLPVMMGAQILFHPNAGLDSLAVSKTKRGGRDGIAARVFENQIFYVFANSVGPQGDGKWSAGDSKIVAPDSRVLALANNRGEMLIHADLDLTQAGRKYAREALREPAFLRSHWAAMVAACRAQLRRQSGES